MKKNCIVAQSGGPTVAINAALAGVISGVIDSKCYNTVFGAINGINGVINNRFINLSKKANENKEFLEQLKITPAMYLGSCRFKLPGISEDKSFYERIFEIFKENSVGAFFYIGGNDSMDTVAKLSEYAKMIGSDVLIAGVPKTIDNDLVLTDHTPGFGSAAKYVATTIREIAYDTFIYAVPSVTIIEIMGRDAGWLTGAAALARNSFIKAPHLIYLPEKSFSCEAFISDIQRLLSSERNVIVAVSEGIRDKDGNYICAGDAVADKFGHAKLSGTGKYLELLVEQKLGVKVRSIELNVLQRCSSHLISKTDNEESFLLGKKAVQLTEAGNTGFMTIIKRTSNKPYTVTYDYTPVSAVANLAKSVPENYINKAGNDVTEEMIEYISPLIEGEVSVNYQSGVASYLDISHLTPDE